MSHPVAPKTPSAAEALRKAAFQPTPYSAGGGKEGYSEGEVEAGSVGRRLFESDISPVAGQTVGGRTIKSVGEHDLGESSFDEEDRDVDAIDFGSFTVSEEGEGVSEVDDSATTQGAASYATEVYTGSGSAAPEGAPTIRRPIAAVGVDDSGQSYATEILKEEGEEVSAPPVAAPLAPTTNVRSK